MAKLVLWKQYRPGWPGLFECAFFVEQLQKTSMKNIPKTGFITFALFLFSLVGTAQSACLRGDCENGFGLCEFPGGARYEGEFRRGQLHGRGILTYPDGSKYIGSWTNQRRSGRGRMILADGSEYLGDFDDNNYQGQGAMRYANGNHYEGEWAAGQPSGQGVFVFANGDRYQGGFQEGRFFGQGVMHYADGARYEGEWAANKRQGMGAMYYLDGQVVSGRWEDDQLKADWSGLAAVGDTSLLRDCTLSSCPDGKGKFIYADGSRYLGDFINGQPQGAGIVYYATGDRYEGGWQRHGPAGRGIMHYADGRIVGGIWDEAKLAHTLFQSHRQGEQPIQVDKSPEIKIWAVIVGAARYTHMPSLRYTDDDAYHIFAFLKSPEGGALPDAQVRLLIDEDATRENVLDAMRSVFLRADENDVVLFYFSGHGLPGAFLPVDYDGYENRLEHDEIRELLRACRAKHKLVLADACHSGSLLAARSAATIEIERYYRAFEESRGGTALLLSSKSEEYSLEDRGLRSGIFSHYLIRGLKGEADSNADQIVTVRELFVFVHQQVRTYTGNIQTPTITGDYDENMPVAFVRR